MGLLHLTADDFTKITNAKGNVILEHNISGFSLILFYSNNCTHCKRFIPIFKSLPGNVSGWQFGLLNINKNKRVVKLSAGTITPITFVPYIIMYYNGKPYMRYDGPQEMAEVKDFVKSVSDSIIKQINANRKEDTGEQDEEKDQNCIPEYCIARPTKGGVTENICYLNFSEAY